jgi:hypothetical protein
MATGANIGLESPEDLRSVFTLERRLIMHGSTIFLIPFKSTAYNDLVADFEKPLSNVFNRLGEKCANRGL